MKKDYITYSLIKKLFDKYMIVFKDHAEYQAFIKELANILEI